MLVSGGVESERYKKIKIKGWWGRGKEYRIGIVTEKENKEENRGEVMVIRGIFENKIVFFYFLGGVIRIRRTLLKYCRVLISFFVG